MQLKGVKNYDEQSIFEAWSIIADMLVDILSIDFKFGLIDPSNLLGSEIHMYLVNFLLRAKKFHLIFTKRLMQGGPSEARPCLM